jgi:hypothetical protein
VRRSRIDEHEPDRQPRCIVGERFRERWRRNAALAAPESQCQSGGERERRDEANRRNTHGGPQTFRCFHAASRVRVLLWPERYRVAPTDAAPRGAGRVICQSGCRARAAQLTFTLSVPTPAGVTVARRRLPGRAVLPAGPGAHDADGRRRPLSSGYGRGRAVLHCFVGGAVRSVEKRCAGPVCSCGWAASPRAAVTNSARTATQTTVHSNRRSRTRMVTTVCVSGNRPTDARHSLRPTRRGPEPGGTRSNIRPARLDGARRG